MKNKNKAPLTRGLSAKLTGGSLGITLIALIITIIVMLILAMVSIKVASDSGLFSKAETAASETEKESTREIVQDIIMECYDPITGKVNMNELKDKLDNKGIENEEKIKNGEISSIDIKVKGEKIFTIEQNGTVANYEEPKNYVRQDGLAYVITGEETATVYGDKGDIDYSNIMNLMMTFPTTTGSVEILSQIEINEEDYTVTTIGQYAFFSMSGSATGLTSITIPNSVTEIGSSAFSGCTALSSITIPNSVTSIGGSVFYNTPWLETQKANATNGLVIVNNNLIDGSNATGDVIIPNNVTTINTYAFYGCTSLNSITIPNSVTKIDFCAFWGCTSIIEIIIPNSVIEISSPMSPFVCWTSEQTIKVYWNEGERPVGWPENWNDGCSANIIYGYTN